MSIQRKVFVPFLDATCQFYDYRGHLLAALRAFKHCFENEKHRLLSSKDVPLRHLKGQPPSAEMIFIMIPKFRSRREFQHSL